jgi:hypothetical protein
MAGYNINRRLAIAILFVSVAIPWYAYFVVAPDGSVSPGGLTVVELAFPIAIPVLILVVERVWGWVWRTFDFTGCMHGWWIYAVAGQTESGQPIDLVGVFFLEHSLLSPAIREGRSWIGRPPVPAGGGPADGTQSGPERSPADDRTRSWGASRRWKSDKIWIAPDATEASFIFDILASSGPQASSDPRMIPRYTGHIVAERCSATPLHGVDAIEGELQGVGELGGGAKRRRDERPTESKTTVPRPDGGGTGDRSTTSARRSAGNGASPQAFYGRFYGERIAYRDCPSSATRSNDPLTGWLAKYARFDALGSWYRTVTGAVRTDRKRLERLVKGDAERLGMRAEGRLTPAESRAPATCGTEPRRGERVDGPE